MSSQTKRSIWITLFWLNLFAVIFFWWMGSGEILFQSLSSTMLAVGRLLGLIATYFILLQFFLMGRNPLFESVFGLDTLSKYHSLTGKVGMIFLLFHPSLIMYSYSSISSRSFFEQYKFFLYELEETREALIAFWILLVVVGLSLTIVRSKLRYENWYYVHLLAYVAVFFSIGHQFELGGTITSSKIFYGYFAILYTLVLANHLLFRLGRPFYRFSKHRFFISRVVRETPSTVSVYISGKNMDKFPVQAGQFMFLRFLQQGFWWQSHPFSLSRLNDGKEIRVTIKELGDFTRNLKNLRAGTKVYIDGPYGLLTEKIRSKSKVLLIAGGIGITPLRSLFERFALTGINTILLYGNRTEDDIPLRSELEEIAAKSGNKTIHVLSAAPNYTGERGYIDEEKIKRFVPDFTEREIYLCGPTAMMKLVEQTLIKCGVPKEYIHTEKFAL